MCVGALCLKVQCGGFGSMQWWGYRLQPNEMHVCITVPDCVFLGGGTLKNAVRFTYLGYCIVHLAKLWPKVTQTKNIEHWSFMCWNCFFVWTLGTNCRGIHSLHHKSEHCFVFFLFFFFYDSAPLQTSNRPPYPKKEVLWVWLFAVFDERVFPWNPHMNME